MTQKTEAKSHQEHGLGSRYFAGGDAVFGNQLDTADLKDVFNAAMENGLNVFDTAYAYANGNLNVFLVNFHAYGRDQVVI